MDLNMNRSTIKPFNERRLPRNASHYSHVSHLNWLRPRCIVGIRQRRRSRRCIHPRSFRRYPRLRPVGTPAIMYQNQGKHRVAVYVSFRNENRSVGS